MPLETHVEEAGAGTPITVVRLAGELDGSNYERLIDQARQLYAAGTRNLLLDLGDLVFMSSSGLVALHSIAFIMRGEGLPDEGIGWSSFHAIANDIEAAAGTEEHFKLLNPQPRVRKTLDTTGFNQILEIYADQESALQSFPPA